MLAVVALAKVAIALENLLAQPTPWPTAAARLAWIFRPLLCKMGMGIAVAAGAAVQCSTAGGSAWALRSPGH